MKTIRTLLLAFVTVLLALAPQAGAQSPGFTITGGSSGSLSGYTLGSEFTAVSASQITHLGALSSLTTSRLVGLWNTSGALLASTTVLTTDPVTGAFRYHALTTPVTLTAGQRYLVGAYYSNTDPITYNATVTTDARVNYYGYAYLNNVGLSFPSIRFTATTNAAGYFGASFMLGSPSGVFGNTGSLATTRYSHTATLLPNGKVLVTGGNNGGTLASAELYDPASGTWTATGSMATARQDHTATLLPNGKVLVVGGYNGSSYVASAELYDPASGTWTATGSLETARYLHTATLLPNGKVLVAGGINGSPLASSELYDPTSGTWTATGSLETARYLHTATLLPNGKVLVAAGTIGGSSLASAQLYDPASGTWATTGSLATARHSHTATLLPNGKVLVAGGVGSSTLASAELYDPASGTWTATGSLATARYRPTATLLPNGKVLVAGGIGSSALASAELYDPASGTWTTTGSLATARRYHTATLLPNGKVLVAGGYGSSALASAELFDPASGTWAATGSLATARYIHTATQLPNGKVLVAGGHNGSSPVANADIYDPASGTWTATGSSAANRYYHTATLLPNGKVLVTGGHNGSSTVASAELYDPASGTWTATGSLAAARYGHTATLLPNGKVLVAGGQGSSSILASAELYDPASGTWTTTGSLAAARYSHTATLLPNGKVLVTGGAGFGSTLASAELYDPATGTWAATSSLAAARYFHTATQLPNGKVLVAGGYGSSALASAELYDPASGTWAVTGSLAAARYQHTATLLPNGKVLVTAGYSGGALTSAELYDVGQGYSASWRPTLTSASFNASGQLVLGGTGFTGISGGSGGSTNDSPTNYPVVQLRWLDNEQSSFLSRDATAGVSATAFTSVTGVNTARTGYALVTVYASGIPSTATVALSPSSVAPTVSAPTSASVTSSTATLGGTVDSDGGATITERGVVVAVTATNSDPTIGGTGVVQVTANGTTGAFTADVSSLSAGTSYTFKAYAINSAGTTYTSAVGFATPLTQGDLAWTYTSAADVPAIGSTVTLSGGTATLALGFAPVPGTELTLVRNVGGGFISGTFGNLAQGQTVTLSFGGVSYDFVANYYGGTGNDLVLVWKTNRLAAWGFNNVGQLGDGTTTARSVPVSVTPGALAGKTVVSIARGSAHSVALCSDGTVVTWGQGFYGQLGNGASADSSTPVMVKTTGALAGKTVVAVTAGEAGSAALCSDGTVVTWGFNHVGQLGDGTTTNSNEPVLVGGLLASKSVVALQQGSRHCLVLCSDGTLFTWGQGTINQLGNGSATDSNVPVAVTMSGVLAGKTVVGITAGGYHNFATCSDGTVAAWGRNAEGRLGDGTTTDRNEPVLLSMTGALAGKTITTLTAGEDFSVALCSDGTLASWGHGTEGELGNSGSSNSATPVAVVTSGALFGKTVVAVSAGGFHAHALCSDGTVVGWGYNVVGQIGDGTTTNRTSPATVNSGVLASGERFSKLAEGRITHHSLAVVAYVPASTPTVTTPTSTSVTTSTATLGGNVESEGTATVTERGVVFSKTSENADPAIGGANVTTVPEGGTATGVFTVGVSGLSEETGYTFKAYATNSAGTGYTSAATFTTAASFLTIQPDAATSDYVGFVGTLEKTLDQSGLSAGYTEGTTSFASATASSVTHNASAVWYASGLAKTVTYDLGATYDVTKFAMWGAGPEAISTFNLLASNDPTFATSTNLGTLTFTNPGHEGASLAETWEFSSVRARYFRLAVLTQTSNRTISIGEVVFGGSLSTTPEISVEQSGVDLASGATRDFGAVNAGGASELTFTIRNTGGAALNLTGSPDQVTVSGTDASLFSVTAQPTSPVNGPSGSINFTVRFAPTSGGTKSATLTMASNDADEGTFTIVVTGAGDAAAPDTSITSGPSNVTNRTGATIVFSGSDDATPSGNLTFEGRLDGGSFEAITSPVELSGLADGSHTYEVRAIDTLGKVDASPASVTWVVDTVAPSFTLPAPITVTATGPSGATVTYSASASDAGSGLASSSFTPASGSVFPVGTTTVEASATDHAGNTATASFTVTVEVAVSLTAVDDRFAATNASLLLDVLANDRDEGNRTLTLGALTQPAIGKVTVEGRKIRFTPPAKTTLGSAVTFTYTVTAGGDSATAMVTVLPPPTGNYLGLLSRAGSVRGRINVTVTATGMATGSVRREGVAFSFRGSVTGPGNVTFGRSAATVPALLTIPLGDLDGSGQPTLAVKLSDTTPGQFLTGTAERSPYDATHPAPQAGRYTLVANLPSSGTGPQTGAALVCNIASNGMVKMGGRLGDNSAGTQGGNLLSGGRFPFYAATGSGAARRDLVGTLVFDRTASPAVNGTLHWKVPAGVLPSLPTGVNQDYDAYGQLYTATDTGVAMFSPTAFTASLTLGLPSPLVRRVSLDGMARGGSQRILFSGGSLYLSPANGFFTGTVSVNRVNRPFFGVVLQGGGVNTGRGNLIDSNAIRTVTLAP